MKISIAQRSLLISALLAASAAAASAQPALAAKNAAALVASRPAILQASPNDAFTARRIESLDGTQYVPYERTHAGLPVVGGDFVIVTDRAGQVVTTSSALKQPIGNLAVRPSSTQAAAEAVARKQLLTVTKLEGSRLVVDALGVPARLAWETTVDGAGMTGISRLTVRVDALTGAVLDQDEHVVHGSGNARWNGPNPVPLKTIKEDATTWRLADPTITRLECDVFGGAPIIGFDDLWGDGNAFHTETGCVDALFGAQTHMRMLSQWLGRNATDGAGGALPIEMGLNEQDAIYNGAIVAIGHNAEGGLISSLDVVAHEFGHGIDDHTPSGLSRNGTQEFIGDAFGAATEWFANEPARFDPPDFLVGETINLLGTGPLRNMFDPAAIAHGTGPRDPNCYSAAIPNTEVHAAAGPGNHWFYLVAEGSNPVDGQPMSPTCNGAEVAGIGIQKAIKILYGAMLMKNSSSSYLTYRTWTLQSAKNLFPDTCDAFNTVKGAWDAVSVPAQPGEPVCVPTTANLEEKFDLNNDGLADVCARGSTGVYCSLSTGASFGPTTPWTPEFNDAQGWAVGPQYYSTIHFPDLNADGRADICMRGSAGVYCALNQGASFGAATVWSNVFSDANHWDRPEYFMTMQFPDLDVDGRADICVRGRDGLWCGLSNGTSGFTGTNVWTNFFSDANRFGDGLQYYSTIQFPDLNHDGRADVCGRGILGISCGLSTGSSFTAPTTWSSFFGDANLWNRGSQYYATIQFPDLDNDGRADVCGRGILGVSCAINTGAAFAGATMWAPLFSDANQWNLGPYYYSTIQFPDLNNDGRADICGRGLDGIWCATSTGTTFGPANVRSAFFNNANGWAVGPQYYGTIHFPDLNNDGRADVCGRSPAGVSCATTPSTGTAFGAATTWAPAFSDAAGWASGPYYWSTLRYP